MIKKTLTASHAKGRAKAFEDVALHIFYLLCYSTILVDKLVCEILHSIILFK